MIANLSLFTILYKDIAGDIEASHCETTQDINH
jgi:hypothetical protein